MIGEEADAYLLTLGEESEERDGTWAQETWASFQRKCEEHGKALGRDFACDVCDRGMSFWTSRTWRRLGTVATCA